MENVTGRRCTLKSAVAGDYAIGTERASEMIAVPCSPCGWEKSGTAYDDSVNGSAVAF